MCGIYGFIGHPANSEKILDLFIDLGIETEIRGTHATGYYGVNTSVHMKKAPQKASDFYLEQKDFYDFYEDVPSVLIGHNRFASCGDYKINKNNHPFMNDRFGFIHNGCCYGWVNQKSLGIQVESDCDSEWIFRYFLKTLELHHNNMFSAIKKTLNTFDEATLACAMVDSKNKKLYLFRNIGNPICYVINKEQNVLIFASTPSILSKALKLHDLPNEKIIDVEKGQILCIDEDLHIETETCQHLRGSRSSYLSVVTSHWAKSHTKKLSSGSGYKCLKCGKKFVSQDYVENHLDNVHHIFEHLDEDEELSDYWENLDKPFYPVKKTINRKGEFRVIKGAQQRLALPAPSKVYSKSFTSFEDMQADTEACLKEMEKMVPENIEAEIS
jgi:glucosamine 6-phosphate synthetase-like amidotransferase/phosphosugar isomerase protein